MGPVENHLIELLPRRDRERLLAVCETVELVLSEVLCEPGQPVRHVYFPTQGFISLVTPVDGSPGVEVGMVGREGMLGAQLALGVATARWCRAPVAPGASAQPPSSASWRAARRCSAA